MAPNKQGPTYTTKTATQTIPATTATSAGAGKITVSFGTAWDYDNESLTYDLFRDNDNVTVLSSTQVKTNFWTLPRKSLTDTGLTPGTSHSYQVRIKDPFGNTLWSPKSNSVTA